MQGIWGKAVLDVTVARLFQDLSAFLLFYPTNMSSFLVVSWSRVAAIHKQSCVFLSRKKREKRKSKVSMPTLYKCFPMASSGYIFFTLFG